MHENTARHRAGGAIVRKTQRWLTEFGDLPRFSAHEMAAMVRAERDLGKTAFRIFVEDHLLAGSDEPPEIEYHYLKARAVYPKYPAAVRLETDDQATVAAGYWVRERKAVGGREHCSVRALQTSWEPTSQIGGVSWQGPTAAQAKAILRYIGRAETDIAAQLGVDPRSLRHWKQGLRAVSPQNWQLLMLLAGFRPGWLDDERARDLLYY